MQAVGKAAELRSECAEEWSRSSTPMGFEVCPRAGDTDLLVFVE
jgi:hypothetical protein